MLSIMGYYTYEEYLQAKHKEETLERIRIRSEQIDKHLREFVEQIQKDRKKRTG